MRQDCTAACGTYRQSGKIDLLFVISILREQKHWQKNTKFPAFESLEEMLAAANPDLDVVSVCTPNGLHAEHSIKVFESR